MATLLEKIESKSKCFCLRNSTQLKTVLAKLKMCFDDSIRVFSNHSNSESDHCTRNKNTADFFLHRMGTATDDLNLQDSDDKAFWLLKLLVTSGALKHVFRQHSPYLSERWQTTAFAMLYPHVLDRYFGFFLILVCYICSFAFLETKAFYSDSLALTVVTILNSILVAVILFATLIMFRGTTGPNAFIFHGSYDLTNTAALLVVLNKLNILQKVKVYVDEDTKIFKKLKALNDRVPILDLCTGEEFGNIWEPSMAISISNKSIPLTGGTNCLKDPIFSFTAIALCNISQTSKFIKTYKNKEPCSLAKHIFAVPSKIDEKKYPGKGLKFHDLPKDIQAAWVETCKDDSDNGMMQYDKILEVILLFGLQHQSLYTSDTYGVNTYSSENISDKIGNTWLSFDK